MNERHKVCKKIRCSHLKEEKCSFHDCIFTTSELIAKAETVESQEFGLFLMKTAGAIALLILFMLWTYSKMGWA